MDSYKFEMKGRAFDDGDRLDKVAAGLTALQHVFDGQFRALSEKKRLHEQDRRLLQVRITRYEDGSFIAYLGAAYTGLQTILPFIYGTASIWEATKNSFEFLKALYELAHQGKEVQVSQNGNGNTVVISGDTHQVFNGPVYQIGTQIIGAIREFDDLLETEEVERIALDGPEGVPIVRLTSDMKGLFFPPTRVDETPVKLTCDIYDFNKYENIGKARVAVDQPIPPGNYKFKNIGDQSVEEFILSMTEPQVVFSCLIKYEHDPLTDNTIAEILVMGVAA
ncbi:MAG: hypothetical protein ACPGJF_15935 [Sinimarinibacterium flocculans]|uniref:hypothetical protein n=1 Tax=Sinimarinibacterium flocculans TaxID=985250 RepID=UPI003C565143